MGFLPWAQHEWFNLFQSLFILAGFIFTCVTLRRDAKSRRVENRFTMTGNHREIWCLLYSRPSLDRILKETVNLEESPVTDEEAIFLTFIFLHLWSCFHAFNDDLLIPPEGLQKDIKWLLARPIPRFVWERSRSLQDQSFVAFVEGFI
jgi:hypothetical protein